MCAENVLKMSSKQAVAPVHVRFLFAFVLDRVNAAWLSFSCGLHAISVSVMKMGVLQASPSWVHVKTQVI